MRKTFSDFASGATCRGLAHKKIGKPNQDHLLIKAGKKLKIICVADGVGSHKYSHKGSKHICRSVYKALVALRKGSILEEQLPEHINKLFSKKLLGKYKNKTATTCIFAAILGNKLYVAQAGDGVCGVIFDGKFKTLGYRKSEFVNEVSPIKADSDNVGKWNFRIVELKKYCDLDIFLGTDGVSDDIIPEKLGDFIRYVFANVEGLKPRRRKACIKKMLKEWSVPYSNDDKTVAILRWNGTANIPEKISEEALVGISKETAENTSENATGKVVEESSGETPTE
jgi:serine/threonine protein phosphatase PrpC